MQSNDAGKVGTLNELPRETRDKLVESVYKVWFEMHVDKFSAATPIPIEVASIQENDIIGSLPRAHDGSQPSGHALALSGGGEPSQPADNELDEPDEHVDFSDVCEPMWRNCVRIAYRNHRVHQNVRSARVIRGKPNHLFREAWLLWQRLPEQIVGKEEKLRQGLRSAYKRRLRANRTAEKCWGDAARMRDYTRRWRAKHLGRSVGSQFRPTHVLYRTIADDLQ